MISSDNELLENAFDVFNRIYFDNSLPGAVITIQSSPRSYGYITVQKVWKNDEDSYHEINISAEHLARPIENVLATLLHEMVHLFCMINNILDTSNMGRYHNKYFKAEAEKRDLRIEYAKYIGYSVTYPTDRLIEVIIKNGLNTGIHHCRTIEKGLPAFPTDGDDNADVNKTGTKKTSTRKYICKHCGISVRATKDVNIICGDCNCTLVKVEQS